MKKAAFISLGIILAFTFVKPAYANVFGYSEAANSYCDSNGNVAIWIRFTNSDSHATGNPLIVTATDEQSNVSVSYGAVASKDTVDKDIVTTTSTNMNGRVRFDVVFPDNSIETEYATYSGKTCTPTATPTQTPVASMPAATTMPTPTATPAASTNTTSTATPSSTPTNTTQTTTNNTTSDGRSDGLGCGSHDCSGNVVQTSNGVVAGVSTARELPSTGSGMTKSILTAIGLAMMGYAMRKGSEVLNKFN